MYAIAIDGELVAANVEAKEVPRILRDRELEGKIELASFDLSKRLWIPVCLDRFGVEAN